MTKIEKLNSLRLHYKIIAKKEKGLLKNEAYNILSLLNNIILNRIQVKKTIVILTTKKYLINQKYLPIHIMYDKIISDLKNMT